jgi:rhomboid protease GluP
MTFDVSRDGQSLGTYSEDGLRRQLTNGDLLPTDLVFLEEQGKWVPISELPGSDADQLAEFREKIESATPLPFVTPALVALNVAIFLVMVIAGVSIMEPTPLDLVRWGADLAPLVEHGQWWRILTAAFLHVGILHLAFNMWALWNSGIFVERLFGSGRFLTAYFLSAAGGDLASIAFQPHTVSAGASGAIFGIYGALIGFLVTQHRSIPPTAVTSLSRNALAFIGYNILFGLNPLSHIDMAAHLGGLLTGLVAGFALAYRSEAFSVASGAKRSLAVALSGLLLFVSAGVSLRRGDAKEAETYTAAYTGRTLNFGNKSHVIYSGEATDADARRLTATLALFGFDKAQGITLLYTKKQGAATVSMMVKEGAWQDPKLMPAFYLLGSLIGRSAAVPLKLRLVDKNLQVKKELTFDGKGLPPPKQTGPTSQH